MSAAGSGHKKALVTGLALFSMFFGSGNLIFPFAVGRFAQGDYLLGALGFLASAVLVPFLGVATMLIYEGDYRRFFGGLGARPGFLLTFVLLTFWIPLGSGPRCITLSHASLVGLIGGCPLWAFGLVYSLIVYWLSSRRGRMMDVLGYVLTPLLLVSLFVVVVAGIQAALPLPPAAAGREALVVGRGALEGYNTMDLIAAFFFSSTIIRYLKGSAPRPPLGLALQASVIGVLILAAVYLGLMYIAAAHAPLLHQVAKESLLPTLAYHLLGAQLGGIAALAVALACLTTSLALAAVYTDFLRQQVFAGRLSNRASLALTSAVTWILSTFGFEFIASLSEPVFQVLYPGLILLIMVLVPLELYRKRALA